MYSGRTWTIVNVRFHTFLIEFLTIFKYLSMLYIGLIIHSLPCLHWCPFCLFSSQYQHNPFVICSLSSSCVKHIVRVFCVGVKDERLPPIVSLHTPQTLWRFSLLNLSWILANEMSVVMVRGMMVFDFTLNVRVKNLSKHPKQLFFWPIAGSIG